MRQALETFQAEEDDVATMISKDGERKALGDLMRSSMPITDEMCASGWNAESLKEKKAEVKTQCKEATDLLMSKATEELDKSVAEAQDIIAPAAGGAPWNQGLGANSTWGEISARVKPLLSLPKARLTDAASSLQQAGSCHVTCLVPRENLCFSCKSPWKQSVPRPRSSFFLWWCKRKHKWVIDT